MDLGCPRSPNQRQRDPWRGASLQTGERRLATQAVPHNSLHNAALPGQLLPVCRRMSQALQIRLCSAFKCQARLPAAAERALYELLELQCSWIKPISVRAQGTAHVSRTVIQHPRLLLRVMTSWHHTFENAPRSTCLTPEGTRKPTSACSQASSYCHPQEPPWTGWPTSCAWPAWAPVPDGHAVRRQPASHTC